MSSPHRHVAGTLEEILVAMADGLREAQDALNEIPPTDAFGRPSGGYHLPYLDFSIKVIAETTQSDEGADSLPVLRLASRRTALDKLHRPRLALHTFEPGSASADSSSLEVTSTLSGRFVAVPPGEGMPVVRLRATASREAAREHAIEVTVSNSAGEQLADVDVEFNLDIPASEALSKADGIELEGRKPATKLAQGVAASDAEGVARNVLVFSSHEPREASFVISINVGNVSTNLTVTV